MTITFKNSQPVKNETPVPSEPKRKRRTHIEPEPYSGSGDFTLANFIYHLDLSHSAVHARTSPSCKRRRISPPDGSNPWTWKLATALEYLRKYQLNYLKESRGIAAPSL
jgi:hypothetical protein